jgi:hypothetical protein
MGDSMIAAIAAQLNAVCISDAPHFKQIKEIQTTWTLTFVPTIKRKQQRTESCNRKKL